MYQFYFIKDIQKQVAVKNKKEIVNKMRQHEWKGKSTNSDYMHVFVTRCKKIDLKIRFQDEEEFIHDLVLNGLIEKVNVFSYVIHVLRTNIRLNQTVH